MFRLALILLFGLASAAAAQEYPVGGYGAYIGPEDLVNSRGARLDDAAQILRQDRANVHRFGVVHEGDEDDPWFGQPEARAAMAELFRAGGGIPDSVARLVVNGDILVVVTIYAVDGNFSALRVEVPG